MADTSKMTPLRRVWDKRISASSTMFDQFHRSGDRVVKQYRIEESNNSVQRNKYNILYSNTETIKPSLYSQTPKVEVQRTDSDGNDPVPLAASMMLEKLSQYQIKEQDDFDQIIMDNVQDYLLPGLGMSWVMYEPTFRNKKDEAGKDLTEDGEDGKPVAVQEVAYERTRLEFVYWKDIRYNRARRWSEIWWIARKTYLDKQAFTKRFGKDIADKITFNSTSENNTTKTEGETVDGEQTVVWEIWDKRSRKVIWLCPDYDDDVVDQKDDPLKLERFFPTPRPLRAISTTNTFMPRPFYSQYQAQAEELDDLTARIRQLSKALRLVGVYDSSQGALSKILIGTENKMVGVDNWVMMAEKGGIKGVMDFVPIQEVAAVLMQCYQARRECKDEIYEITGWSDIIRGVTKASETLGAQQLKSQWAGSRLKLMQKEVERYVCELLRIMAEIAVEHFSPATIAMCVDFNPNTLAPEDRVVALQNFQAAIDLLKSDKRRCASLNIETDSTLMPDEQQDKAARMEFISAAGAFLQQAVPAMQQFPALAPVLGEMLMFSVRGFRAARPLEEKFRKFSEQLDTMAQQPQQQDNGEAAKSQAAMQAKQMDMQIAEQDRQTDMQKHQAEMELEAQKEQNRHQEEMTRVQIEADKVKLEQAKINLEAAKLSIAQNADNRATADQHHKQALELSQHQHERVMDVAGLQEAAESRQERQSEAEAGRAFDAEQNAAERANTGLDGDS